MAYDIRNIRTGSSALLVLLMLFTVSCKKYTDEPGKGDSRLSRKYCNDPLAVNYNRDFPGTADNSVCYYPSDVFEGQYSLNDSISSGGNVFMGEVPLVVTLTAIDHTRLTLSGFCGSGSTISLTANRQLRADVDSTIINGQPLCRDKDTLSGYITQLPGDSTKLHFYFTVVSDTGLAYHQGTAFKH